MLQIKREYKLGNCNVELQHNGYGPYMRVIDYKGVPLGVIGGTSLLMLRDELNKFFGQIGYDWNEHNKALKSMLISDSTKENTDAPKQTALPAWSRAGGTSNAASSICEGAD